MQINAHYTGDLKQRYRMIAYVQRRRTVTSRATAALVVLGVVIYGIGGGSASTIEFLAPFGVVMFIMPDAGLWWALRRNRDLIVRDLDLEMTDLGITRRTSSGTTQTSWEMIQRVDETDDFWIFVINRVSWIGLYKSRLTADQRAELAAFLATRPWAATQSQPHA
jgi:hypothetical protein